MESGIEIQINKIFHGDQGRLNELLGQLSARGLTADLKQIQMVMTHGYIICLRDRSPAALEKDEKGILMGMATLVPVRKVTAYYGMVEDVVIDSSLRGQGWGRRIMERLVAEARAAGMDHLELTSNPAIPERRSAIRLYEALGFEQRPTNVYRMFLGK